MAYSFAPGEEERESLRGEGNKMKFADFIFFNKILVIRFREGIGR